MAFDYTKIPHEDVTDSYRFLNLPSDILDAREAGKITPLMYDCLTWIYRHAGYRTGIVERASASMILKDMWPLRKDRPKKRTVQRAVRLLSLCGYITLPKSYVQNENYPIFVHGYVVPSDGRKLALRPKKTIGYREAVKGVDAAFDETFDVDVTQTCRTSDADVSQMCRRLVASSTMEHETVDHETYVTGRTNQLINEGRAEKSVSKSENGNLSLQGQEKSEAGSSREKKAKRGCGEKSSSSRENYESSPSKKSGRKPAGKNHDKHPAKKNQRKHSAPATDGVKDLNKLVKRVEADADRIIEEGFKSWKS